MVRQIVPASLFSNSFAARESRFPSKTVGASASMPQLLAGISILGPFFGSGNPEQAANSVQAYLQQAKKTHQPLQFTREWLTSLNHWLRFPSLVSQSSQLIAILPI